MLPHNPRNLHVIIYSPFPRYSGGRENWLFNVLRQLDRFDFRVFVYAFQSDRPLFYDLEPFSSVRMVSVPSIRSRHVVFRYANIATLRLLSLADFFFGFPRAVGRHLKHNVQDGDVVLAMNPIIDIRPALQLREAGREFRLVCSVRGQPALELSLKMPWLRSLFYRLERETLAQADCILANGYDTQDRLRREGFDSRVILNGVDVSRFSRPDLADPALMEVQAWYAAGFKLIASVASLRPIKGINELLQSARILKRIYPKPFRYLFIGKGDVQRYELKAAALKLADEAVFVGEQRNVPGFLHYADVLAAVSGGGGMSMACLEGMAARRAIVAWDTPIYQQLIRHGESGLLVPPGDAQALAEAIKLVLESNELAQNLGTNAYVAANKHDWPLVVQQLIPVLFNAVCA